jgi:putative peptide zinc metalloprotease protein
VKLALNHPRPQVGPPPTLPERPCLAADVLVHEPAEDGAPWVVQFDGRRYLRVGAGMARLLALADGKHTAYDIAAELGGPWSPELVYAGLLRAQQTKLLQDSERRASPRRFTFVPPLTFQFTVLRPDRLLSRFRPLTARLARRGWATALAVLAVAGLFCVAFQLPAAANTLGSPVAVPTLVLLVCLSYVGVVLHEFAHGLVLSHYGGRPSRMGVMLFYLAPAFFCDVTDGWRLPRKSQRVQVALAGISTQVAIGGLAAVGSAVVAAAGGGSEPRDLLLLLAVSNYVAGVFNAVPFVKLDGYLALMSHLDRSHLRERSMVDARRLTARLLFGGRYERALPEVSWAPWFGLVCMIFPVYVVGMAFTIWRPVLEDLGMVGATVVALVLTYVLLRLYSGAARLIVEARKAGARAWRIALVSATALAALTAISTGVSLPYTVTGGFVIDQGQVLLVTTGAADQAAIRTGAEVTLERSGIVFHDRLGRATVAAADPTDVSAPLSVFAPVKGLDGLRVPASGIGLETNDLPADTTGLAVVHAGRRSLGTWLYLRYLAPFWR